MTAGERLRNLIEENPLAEQAFESLSAVPGYRRLIFRLAQRRSEYVRRNRLISLMIELSSVCNARCAFCPQQNLGRPKQIMDDSLFNIIVDRLHSERLAPPIIDLFDVGEPLTDRKLFQRVRTLKAAVPLSQIRTTTNFGLATPTVIDDLLSSGLDRIHISLNADSPETYRAIMGLDFARTIRNIDLLLHKREAARSSLYVLLSFVICDNNKNEVRAFVQKWKSRVDRLVLQRAVPWGGAIDVPGYVSYNLYPCEDLFTRIPILSNGEYGICCQDYRGSVGLNVRDTPILEAFRSAPFQRLQDRHLSGDIASLDACKNCFGVHSNGTNWLLHACGWPR